MGGQEAFTAVLPALQLPTSSTQPLLLQDQAQSKTVLFSVSHWAEGPESAHAGLLVGGCTVSSNLISAQVLRLAQCYLAKTSQPGKGLSPRRLSCQG